MQKLFTLALAMASATMLFAQSFSNASSSLPDSYNSGNCVGFTDMNNDGFDDIVVLDQSKTVKVLYQDGDGAFTEVDYGSVSNSNQWGMTIGDYDNDGHKDVFSGGSYDGVHIKHIDAVGIIYRHAAGQWQHVHASVQFRGHRQRWTARCFWLS